MLREFFFFDCELVRGLVGCIRRDTESRSALDAACRRVVSGVPHIVADMDLMSVDRCLRALRRGVCDSLLGTCEVVGIVVFFDVDVVVDTEGLCGRLKVSGESSVFGLGECLLELSAYIGREGCRKGSF